MKQILLTTCAALCLISMDAAAAFRADVVADRDLTVEGETWALQFSTGLLDGKAKEYVFIYDSEFGGGRHKLSELDWDIKRVVMVGGNLTLREGRGTINIGYWRAVSEGDDGHMKDYDWLDPNASHFTEYSDSFTDVTSASIFDINGGWEFLNDYFGFNARALFGYKMDTWKWDARGGYGLYSDLNYEPYYFPESTIGKYKQKISMPYLGGSVDWAYGGFMLSVYCTYSPFVRIKADDNHILRVITFTDKFKDGEMVAAGASARYELESGWFFTAAFDFQKISTIVGDSRYNQYSADLDMMESAKSYDSAGASNKYLSLSLGVGKSF